MDDKTVATEPSASEPNSWAAEIAAELHRIADDFAKVDHTGLPKPRCVGLAIQPGGPANKADDEVIGTVDAIGLALLGKPGRVEALGRDGFHYAAEGRRAGINVGVYREVSTARVEQMKAGEALAAKEAELAALRAEVQQLRAAAVLTPDAVFDHSRKPAEDMTLTLTGEVPPTDPGDLPAQDEVATTYEPVTEACEIDDEDYCATHEAVHVMPPTGPGDPDAS